MEYLLVFSFFFVYFHILFMIWNKMKKEENVTTRATAKIKKKTNTHILKPHHRSGLVTWLFNQVFFMVPILSHLKLKIIIRKTKYKRLPYTAHSANYSTHLAHDSWDFEIQQFRFVMWFVILVGIILSSGIFTSEKINHPFCWKGAYI